MSYYESAEGVQINEAEAFYHLKQYGMRDEDVRLFFNGVGVQPFYNAQELLDWLGY